MSRPFDIKAARETADNHDTEKFGPTKLRQVIYNACARVEDLEKAEKQNAGTVLPLPLPAVYIHMQAIASHGCSISYKRELANDGKSERMVVRAEGTGRDGEKFWHCAFVPWPCQLNEDICAPLRLIREAVERECYPVSRLAMGKY